MTRASLVGKWVRLCAPDYENDSKAMARWFENSTYSRLLASEPAMLPSPANVKTYLSEDDGDKVTLHIRTIQDDRLIGECSLSGFEWASGNAWVGIGLGESEFWGLGYGTEAMRLLLDYAFLELGLRRISLDVFEYNPRALHCYENLGFRREGVARKALLRAGRRWDMIYMGLLRREWEEIREQQG